MHGFACGERGEGDEDERGEVVGDLEDEDLGCDAQGREVLEGAGAWGSPSPRGWIYCRHGLWCLRWGMIIWWLKVG